MIFFISVLTQFTALGSVVGYFITVIVVLFSDGFLLVLQDPHELLGFIPQLNRFFRSALYIFYPNLFSSRKCWVVEGYDGRESELG